MITHAVIFAPLGQATRSEQVVERLSNAIVSGLLEAHEQLPNESDLAKLMGVSHITIREALNTLREKALIYTTRGRNGGSFICELATSREDQHPLKNMTNNYLADLGEMHCAVMKHSVGLAVRHSTQKDIQKLNEFIISFKHAVSPEQKAQADMRCLLTIAAHAQSPRLAHHALVLQTEWASLVAVLYRNENIYQKMMGYYDDLVASFFDQNEVFATHLIGEMLTYLTEELIDQRFKVEQSCLE